MFALYPKNLENMTTVSGKTRIIKNVFMETVINAYKIWEKTGYVNVIVS